MKARPAFLRRERPGQIHFVSQQHNEFAQESGHVTSTSHHGLGISRVRFCVYLHWMYAEAPGANQLTRPGSTKTHVCSNSRTPPSAKTRNGIGTGGSARSKSAGSHEFRLLWAADTYSLLQGSEHDWSGTECCGSYEASEAFAAFIAVLHQYSTM